MSRRKKTVWAVAAFVAAFVFLLAYEAKASTALELVPGVSWVGSERYTGTGLAMHERFAGKYDVGLWLMSSQETSGSKRPDYGGNMAFNVQRIVRWKDLELGLGGTYWANETPAWSSNTTFSLSVGYRIGSFEVRVRHFSTGGSSARNSGLDILTFGWRFL